MDVTNAARLQNFGAAVRRARLSAKLTQEAFAEKCDISVNYLSNLEHGKQDPRLSVIAKLAAGAGIKPHALLRRARL